jgi:hypothetical protein
MDRNCKMVKLVIGVSMLFMIFASCNEGKPSEDELIGSWISWDSAIIQINKGGEFTCQRLPAEYFSFQIPGSTEQRQKIQGYGKWRLERNDYQWEIKLDFQVMNNASKSGFYSVFISGSKGLLENQGPWYLFVWKGEEGGERYEFFKK